MRKTLILLMVATMLLSLGSVSLAATIKGSKHDLSTTGHAAVQTDETQVCVFCHTPHNASTIGPLWNRKSASELSPVPTYTLYDSESLDATPGQPLPGTRNVKDQASGSDLCLSCHDGTIAASSVKVAALHDSAGNRPQAVPKTGIDALDANGFIKSTRPGNLGINLADDHPVGFNYDLAVTAEASKYGAAQLAASKVRGTNSQKFVDGSKGANGSAVDLPLFNGNMECDSCHNVHDPGDVTAQTYPFLRATMDASKLCFTCHLK